MRLISTLLLCLLIVGGTWTYLNIDKEFKREAAEVLYDKASGITLVSIDRTFECFGNPDFEEPAIRVRFGGEDVFLDQSESIKPEKSVEFELEGVEELENTLTVFANATSPESFGDDAPPLRAMVVRVHYDDRLIAEQFFHAEASEISLGGDVNFSIPSTKEEDHDHVH